MSHVIAKCSFKEILFFPLWGPLVVLLVDCVLRIVERKRRWRAMQCFCPNKSSVHWWYLPSELQRDHKAKSLNPRRHRYVCILLCYSLPCYPGSFSIFNIKDAGTKNLRMLFILPTKIPRVLAIFEYVLGFVVCIGHKKLNYRKRFIYGWD